MKKIITVVMFALLLLPSFAVAVGVTPPQATKATIKTSSAGSISNLSAAITAISLLGLTALANSDGIEPYVGIGFGGYTLSGNQKTTTLGSFGQFGINANAYLGSEVRVGFSGKSSYGSGASAGKVNIDYIFSYLGKIRAPIGHSIYIYTLLGGSTATLTNKLKSSGSTFANSGTNTLSTRSSGFSFGGGLSFKTLNSLSIDAEYMHYYKDVSGFSANLKYSF